MQLHLRITPAVAELLDVCRGAATRPAYAAMVLERELQRQAGAEYAREVAEIVGRLEDADRRITPEHVAERFGELTGGTQESPEPKRGARKDTGTSGAAKAPSNAEPQDNVECHHVFPDVKFVAGTRVCRKCD